MHGVTSDRIVLRDYVRRADIGAFETERGLPQRLRFSIALTLAGSGGAGSDEVDGVLSYDSLVAAVDGALAEGRVALLETLAERIAARCLAHPGAAEVGVAIDKLDRGPFALGVEISRDRKTLAHAISPVAVPGVSPRVFWVPTARLEAPGLGARVAQLADSGGVVLCPGPWAGRPRVGDAPAQRRMDLLAQDQAGWLLATRLPDCRTAASRTEIAAVLHAGAVAVWLPAAMVLRAPPPAPVHPAAQAGWLAQQLGTERVSELGADGAGTERAASGVPRAPAAPLGAGE